MTRPDGLVLTQTRIAGGVWEGVLTGAGASAPAIEAQHQGLALAGVQVLPFPGRPGQYVVQLPIPPEILSEGVQTVLLLSDGVELAQFSLIAGTPLEQDLRAEISLLRAELDLLKRAFRRHCAETAGH